MKSIILSAAAVVAAASIAAAQPGYQNQQGNTNDTNAEGTNGNDMSGNAAMTGTTGGAMSDANVAAMIKAINDTEVKAGKLAEKHGKSKGVKNFARMMVREHGGNNRELAMVEKRVGIQPQLNDEITAMQDQAKQDTQALESASGGDFDTTYIDQMVKGHEDALKKLDDAIANNAGRNERLAEFLKKTRRTVARHLDEARKLQSESGAGSEQEGGNENGNE